MCFIFSRIVNRVVQKFIPDNLGQGEQLGESSVTEVNSAELLKVKEFARNKLYSFAKGGDWSFSPDHFIASLWKYSTADLSEVEFAERRRTLPPFKVKLIVVNAVLINREKIVNTLIAEIRADLLKV